MVEVLDRTEGEAEKKGGKASEAYLDLKEPVAMLKDGAKVKAFMARLNEVLRKHWKDSNTGDTMIFSEDLSIVAVRTHEKNTCGAAQIDLYLLLESGVLLSFSAREDRERVWVDVEIIGKQELKALKKGEKGISDSRLSAGHRAIIGLVHNYLETSGKKGFTYNSIKYYASRSGFYRKFNLTDRTLERELRRLADMGIFQRIAKKDSKGSMYVLYLPTSAFYKLNKLDGVEP